MRAFVLGLAMLVAAGMAAAETRYVNSPGDGFLNLRTGPGTGFSIIMPMYHGSSVEILEWAGNWVRVRHASGAEGWAYAKYLVAPDPTGAVMRVAWTSDGFLNLRTGPGTRYAIIRPMFTGSYVEVLEVAGNWVRVRHETGDEGWAYSRYLTR